MPMIGLNLSLPPSMNWRPTLRNYLKTPPNAQIVIPAKAGTQAPVSITFRLATPAKGPPRPDRGREPSGPIATSPDRFEIVS